METKEQLFKQLLDESNQMIQVSDINTFSMMYVNRIAKEYTGHANQPYMGKHCYEYMMGLKEQCPFCPMRKIGDEDSFETEVDNGKEVYMVKTKKTKWDGKDAFVEYAWDVTQLRRSQQIYENQIQMLLSAIAEAQGIFHMDITEDKVLTINGSSQAITNMNNLNTVNDMVQMIASFIPEDSKQKDFFQFFCRDALIQAYDKGKTELTYETMSYFDDQSIRPARITGRLLMNPISNHLECIIYGMDISLEWNEKNKREKQLNEQLEVFNILSRNFRNVYLANLNDGTAKILKIDSNYDFDVVEKMKNQVFSYEEVIKYWVIQKVHPDDQERMLKALSVENVRKVFLEKDEYIGNYRRIDHGKVVNYQYNLSKLNDKGGVIAGFQIIDPIIEEHLAEEKKKREIEEAYKEQLIAAKNEADLANASKTEFLLRMSHDIRTPINGIMGMLDIAERYPDDMNRQTECRRKIKDSSKILLELINEVLDMTKLESGEVVLEHVPFNINEVAIEVYNIIKKQAEERNIEIIQVDCGTKHKNLIGSPLHLKRLMMNILSNAIKYNKDHGKIYITCKEVSDEGNISNLEFKCRDTGVGMSPEFIEHIFEPFAQESGTARSKFGGTGLGMSIVEKLVKKMGGTIVVDSKKEEGSTFDVIIPFEINQSKRPETKVEEQKEKPSIQGLKILLVEDNDLNMEIAKFLLEEEGADVIEVWNGQEAVDAFKHSCRNSIDVILMDVMMPIMDGYQATQIIRSMDRSDAQSIPILAMTANAFTEDKIKAREAGMNAHISKPLDTKLLVETISKLVKENGVKHESRKK